MISFAEERRRPNLWRRSLSSDRSVRLTYGIHDLYADIAGLTVAESEIAFRDVLNLGANAEAYLNGRWAEPGSSLRTGDRLEWIKSWGRKGGGGIHGETLLTLSQAARQLPRVRGAKPLSPATMFRWIGAGLKSRSGKIVKLESCLVGGTRCTSKEALERFFQRLDDLEPSGPPPTYRDRRLEKQTDEAMDILRSRGIVDAEGQS